MTNGIDERALEVIRLATAPRDVGEVRKELLGRQNAAAAVRHERIRKRRPSFRHVEMSHWRRRTFRRRRVARQVDGAAARARAARHPRCPSPLPPRPRRCGARPVLPPAPPQQACAVP